MREDDILYLGHILDHSRELKNLSRGMTREQFDANRMAQLAFVYLPQIVGEASRKVSSDFRDSHPEFPRRLIAGMRNRIVHDYVNIQLDIVWGVIQNDLDELIAHMAKCLPEEPPQPSEF